MQPPCVGTDISALQLPVGFITCGGEEVKAKRSGNNGSAGGRPLNRLPRRALPSSASDPPPPQTLLLIQAAHKRKVQPSNAIMPLLWPREQRLVPP